MDIIFVLFLCKTDSDVTIMPCLHSSCLNAEDYIPVCQKDMEERLKSSTSCGMIKDMSGPFASCLKNGILPDSYYRSVFNA